MMTSSQTSPIPHIIPDVIPFIIVVHLPAGAAITTRHSYCCESDDAESRDGDAPRCNAVSSSGPRAPFFMHMNIINMHGRNASMGSSPAAVTQFQFTATPEATTAPEKRSSAKRCRMKQRLKVPRSEFPPVSVVAS